MCWSGTSPRLIIKDPEMMKEVLLNKLGHFGKPRLGPMLLILTRGLTTLEGDAWANRRKMINPAFHMEKLKVLYLFWQNSLFSSSSSILLSYLFFLTGNGTGICNQL